MTSLFDIFITVVLLAIVLLVACELRYRYRVYTGTDEERKDKLEKAIKKEQRKRLKEKKGST